MSEKAMLTQAQVIALLRSDDEYWAQIEAIRARWELPDDGFPIWTLATYYDESAATPLAQWEAGWQTRQVDQPAWALEAEIAAINRCHGLPPAVDRWVGNHLLHGDHCELPYTRATVERDDPDALGPVSGVGIFGDEHGKLAQIDWTATTLLTEQVAQVWQGTRLTAFSLGVGDRFAPPTVDIVPNSQGYGSLLWYLRGRQTLMHNGAMHLLTCEIGFPSWNCDFEALALADLCFVLHSSEAASSKSCRGRPRLSEEDWKKRREQISQVDKLHDTGSVTYEGACARVGVPYSSLRRWRRELTIID